MSLLKNLPLFLPKNSTIFFSSSSSASKTLNPPPKSNLSLLHPKNAAFSQLFTSSASKTLNPSPKSNPIAEYLINSCGFSSQKADSASTRISRFVSVEQAHSVRHFFKHHGLTDTHIRSAISNCPRILSVDVEKTLEPNFLTLCTMGFTEAELQVLIASSPCVIVSPLAIPRLEFWQNFLRTDNKKDLVSLFKRYRNLISHDIDSGIAPKVSLLKEHGISEHNIVGIMKRGQGVITLSIKSLEALLKRTKELGFNPKSPMFAHALSSLSGFGSGSLEAKMEFFKAFGWSDKELLAAFKKAPSLFRLSEENIQEKMDFLVGRAGCKQSYIASRPVLLMLSLEKRLKPRRYVMEILKSNEIVGRRGLYSIMCFPEKKFVETIILPCKEQVPNIHEIYVAACAGEIPI